MTRAARGRFLVTLAAVCLLLFCRAQAQMENPERKPIPAGAFRIAGVVVNAKAASPLAQSRRGGERVGELRR